MEALLQKLLTSYHACRAAGRPIDPTGGLFLSLHLFGPALLQSGDHPRAATLRAIAREILDDPASRANGGAQLAILTLFELCMAHNSDVLAPLFAALGTAPPGGAADVWHGVMAEAAPLRALLAAARDLRDAPCLAGGDAAARAFAEATGPSAAVAGLQVSLVVVCRRPVRYT